MKYTGRPLSVDGDKKLWWSKTISAISVLATAATMLTITVVKYI